VWCTMFRVCIALVANAAAHQSVTNCGSTTDHLVIHSLTLDADAAGGIRKGKPFTVTATGTFDEVHQHGTVAVDLNVKALGIVNEPVKLSQAYDFLPGLAKGDAKLVIGPVTIPRILPGAVDVTGGFTLVNEKSEPVACINLDAHIPALFEEEKPEESLESQKACTPTPSDHISNIVTQGATTTMDLDEDLDYVDLAVDISVKAPLLPAVHVQLPKIPVSYVPGIPAGQLTFVDKNQASVNSAVTVTGTVQLSDKKGEQVLCAAVDGAAESAVSV